MMGMAGVLSLSSHDVGATTNTFAPHALVGAALPFGCTAPTIITSGRLFIGIALTSPVNTHVGNTSPCCLPVLPADMTKIVPADVTSRKASSYRSGGDSYGTADPKLIFLIGILAFPG